MFEGLNTKTDVAGLLAKAREMAQLDNRRRDQLERFFWGLVDFGSPVSFEDILNGNVPLDDSQKAELFDALFPECKY